MAVNEGLLFHSGRPGHSLREFLESRRTAAALSIDRLDPEEILSRPLVDIEFEVVERATLPIPKLHRDEAAAPDGLRETTIDVTGNIMYGQRFDGGPTYTAATSITVEVPVDGPTEAFTLQASQFTLNPQRGTHRPGRLMFTIKIPSHQVTGVDLQSQIDRQLDELERHVGYALADIEAFNGSLRGQISSALHARRERLLAQRQLEASLTLPVGRRSEALTPIPVPLRSKITTTPRRPATRSTPFAPEPALSEPIVTEIMQSISRWAESVERLPETYATMGEEALRDTLLAVLNGSFEYAGAEAFRRKGKTDITVQVTATNTTKEAFVIELKFWTGPAAFTAAIDQLLGYMLWRDSYCAILPLIRTKNPTATIDQIPALIANHPMAKRTAPPVPGIQPTSTAIRRTLTRNWFSSRCPS